MNNKFGLCCSCPALNDGRFLTSYIPRREYNASVMKEIGANDSHAYRETLQKNGEEVMKVIVAETEKRFKCRGQQFYNVTDINGHFNAKLKAELSKKININ